MDYQKYIVKPSVDMFPGIKVTKETVLEYKNENVEQTVKDLVLHSVTKVKGEDFESVQDVTVYLAEGDVLVFEDQGRGYFKPVQELMTVAEAIKELSYIDD